MDINRMIRELKHHPEYTRMGMIATHLGVVRETSLDGRGVAGVVVGFDEGAIENVIRDTENMPGIVAVRVETASGELAVGEEIMAVVVGGDTREHVFPALMTAVDRIKKECTRKRELF
jgi:molybdopterin synthase catalytic subunit